MIAAIQHDLRLPAQDRDPPAVRQPGEEADDTLLARQWVPHTDHRQRPGIRDLSDGPACREQDLAIQTVRLEL
jgi:hypothetical protein